MFARRRLHPPSGRVEGEERAFGEGHGGSIGVPTTLPGNSLTLVSDPPEGRVKSLCGIHLFGFALKLRIPDPVAWRGENSYSRFSSLAMARATASASSSTSWSRKRMTFQPLDSRCFAVLNRFPRRDHDSRHQSRPPTSAPGTQSPRATVQANVGVETSNRTIVAPQHTPQQALGNRLGFAQRSCSLARLSLRLVFRHGHSSNRSIVGNLPTPVLRSGSVISASTSGCRCRVRLHLLVIRWYVAAFGKGMGFCMREAN